MAAKARKPDFSGWATKAGIRCSDGRTISAKAFEHMDGQKVPLFWKHGHHDLENVLGHAFLKANSEGVKCYAYFNNSPKGKLAREAVQHGDIDKLSIYANQLAEHPMNGGKTVTHGMIREVSIVPVGANPGAMIDFVAIRHADDTIEQLEDEAVIHTGLTLEHEDLPEDLVEAAAAAEPELTKELEEPEPVEGEPVEEPEPVEGEPAVEHADKSVQDVLATYNEEQTTVLNYLVGLALEGKAAQHDDNDENPEGDLTHQEGKTDMNVFKDAETGAISHSGTGEGTVLKHEWTAEEMRDVASAAVRLGSFRAGLQEAALKHGIENLESLFPEPTNLDGTPKWIKRRTEWVAGVLSGVNHTPKSRLKTRFADITQEAARAKGYIKGNYKKEEWFDLTHRTTTPTTVYKKQALDRDDILDASDFDLVAWMKPEMRLMLEEEIARAILVGDGRDVDDEDKIRDPNAATDGAGIRSIANDHELFVSRVYVASNFTYDQNFINKVMTAMDFYRGTGSPTMYMRRPSITKLLLLEDGFERRRYADRAALADAMGVGRIQEVEVMQEAVYDDIVAVIVNLADYTTGTDRGGEVTMFDDFDIDFNKNKWLLETRLCGALTEYKSAIVIQKAGAGATLVEPAAPTFDEETGEITITDTTGVVYKHGATVVNNAGSPYTLAEDETWVIDATPASSSYYFSDNENDSWTFKFNAEPDV